LAEFGGAVVIALLGLFGAALIAATLIPAQSEAVLVALLLAGTYPVWLLLVVASAGNVLGAIINWGVGRYAASFSQWRWFPASPARLEQAAGWYRRWGYLSLLGSWLPVVGDPITVAAGFLREPLWRFTLLVTLAKAGRYAVVAAVTLQFI
jgi:membrane protein YqaA with SNARE-associated domain